MTQPGRAHYHRTSSMAVTLLIAIGMFLLLRLTGNSWFLLLLGAVLGVFGIAVCSRAHLEGLTLVAMCEARVAVGQDLSYTFRVANRGHQTSSPTSVLLHTDGLADVTVYVGALAPDESATFTTQRAALQRGVSERSRIEYSSNPSLGLVRAHLIWSRAQPLTIHPQLVDVGRTKRMGGYPDEAGGAAIHGPGTDVLGVREWHRGDDHRHVHWRSTARHGRLVVLERGQALTPALRLLLIGPASADGFEAALSAAAGTCDSELHAGQPVTVAAWLTDGLAPAPSASRRELLDWWSSLTDVTVPGAADFMPAAVAAFGAGELVVAGPPETLNSWLPAAMQTPASLILRRLEVGS